MSAATIAVPATVAAVHIYLVVRCFRRGRWGYGLAGLLVLAPCAWIGAFLEPKDRDDPRRGARHHAPS
jgi:hypothetical protein